MKEIFDTYLESTLGNEEMNLGKIPFFEHNYRHLLPKDSSAPILDIGVGKGELLKSFQTWGYTNFKGIDISRSTVAFCQKHDLPCELVADTAEYLDRHSNTYSVITLIEVLEHIPASDAPKFVKSIYDSLADDGMVIIQVPNMHAPDAQLHYYQDVTHVKGYSEASLIQLLKFSGFKNFEAIGFETLIKGTKKLAYKRWRRSLFWKLVRFSRRINENINPNILHPAVSVIARK